MTSNADKCRIHLWLESCSDIFFPSKRLQLIPILDIRCTRHFNKSVFLNCVGEMNGMNYMVKVLKQHVSSVSVVPKQRHLSR